MNNLDIYNKTRMVPKEALKEIQAGRLKGKSDINPMWRIKALTEQFGPCGIGWKYSIIKQWLEPGIENEISAFVNIELCYKHDGNWSEPIPGTGGSSFVTKESKGLYQSDECFKMALTDAISVACKALGFGADVYWDKDTTKYNKHDTTEKISELQVKALKERFENLQCTDYVLNGYGVKRVEDITPEMLVKINDWCNKQEAKRCQPAS